ncbi:hypothetical protein [Thermohalobacter berrensis]|uniref:Uncharacterized protein n=1 Tax=Thermohalobacter berrensis TaxID=99594 RepID=A0A419T1D5_9FIRM|nr:hypothetical protein [Thermohalobacter berrensis]RKD31239.1 hypothetical protein BET03_03685 [Thermohalobacter berrensis]
MLEYPQLYYDVYPRVRSCVDRHNYPGNPDMYPYPNREQLDTMVNEVYDEMIEEYPEIDNDPGERRRPRSQQRPFFGRRRIFRDLIGVLLIQELLRRRRYPYGYYRGYPGYPYGYLYDYPGYDYY